MDHTIGTRQEWDEARRTLLAHEKELTRMSDRLATERQALPWVRVDATYVFDTEQGPRSLAELFDGRSQLFVYHFMLGPGWGEGCPSCSSLGDHIDLPRVHLEHHDVTWTAVSRAPLPEILAYRERMGWTFPWASSFGNEFNFDFHVSSTDEHPLLEYNFRAISDEDRANGPGELPGMSAFVLRDGVVYHTYSAYARGLDATWGMYQWLDRRRSGATKPTAPTGSAATTPTTPRARGDRPRRRDAGRGGAAGPRGRRRQHPRCGAHAVRPPDRPTGAGRGARLVAGERSAKMSG